MYKIAAFYRFVPINDVPEMRARIRAFGETIPGLCGTILLAPEGINGTIGAYPDGLDKIIALLDELTGLHKGEVKYSASEKKPFTRFKVRPKKEIITMKCGLARPEKIVGEYVSAEDWNALTSDPDVITIDTRNIYETKVGTFEGAVDPNLSTFSEFPRWVEQNLDPEKHKKIAMFCTGGIRCEKASSYMLAAGFENVYHLKGGILKYLETIPAEQSRWNGECFVFDRRVAVGHGLEQGNFSLCHACREPLSEDDVKHAAFEEGVSCPHCAGKHSPRDIEILRHRHRQLTARGSGSDQ